MNRTIEGLKIFGIIEAMSLSELRHLRKLLHSNYLTSRVHLKRLFEVLVKKLKKGSQSPSAEWLFYQVFPDQVFEEGQLRKAMSDLLQVIHEGLLIHERRNNELESNMTLLKLMRDRRQGKAFRSLARKTAVMIDQHAKRNTSHFQNLLAFQTELFRYETEEKQITSEYLQGLSDLEDIVYLSKKLRTACAQLSHQRVHKKEFNLGLLPDLHQQIAVEKYLDIPAIALYYYCYMFLNEPQEPSYFQKFKKTFKEHSHLFTIEDLADSYRAAINYCIRKNNEGDRSFLRELWELYTNGLDQGILLIENEIPRFTFDNALTAGLRLEEYDWAKKFIEEKAKFLNPEHRQQTVLFNQAKLAYEQKDYETALVQLSSATFKELRINIVGKIMLLKIFYELKSFAALDSHIQAFQRFVRRRKVNDYHRQNILNIAGYLHRLISLATYDQSERRQLRNKIEQEKILSEREWLLEKLAE